MNFTYSYRRQVVAYFGVWFLVGLMHVMPILITTSDFRLRTLVFRHIYVSYVFCVSAFCGVCRPFRLSTFSTFVLLSLVRY